MAASDSTIEVGARFGRLTITAAAIPAGGCGTTSKRAWPCVCDCGRTITVPTSALKSGRTRSCGCLHREEFGARNRTHGKSTTRTYMIWGTMVNRCTNASQRNWEFYNSIELDPYFLVFDNFLAEVGDAPEGMTLDREDNTKGYVRGNIRWASWKTQQRNRGDNRLLIFRGESRCLAEWCEILNLSYKGVGKRLSRGATIEDAFKFPCGDGWRGSAPPKIIP